MRIFSLITLLFTLGISQSFAEEDSAVDSSGGDNGADLANQLANPVASLTSVPFQSNFDFGAGAAGNGFQYKLNVQPVIPISLNDDWNLISRTIIPVVYQKNIFGNTSQDGLSDVTQSFFFSPVEPTSNGWITGFGPAFLFPTASSSLLGTEKWGAGPTGLVLKQENGWTYGALVNHLWTVGGEDTRADVNGTFIQPFLNYVTPMKTTFGLNAESTYDWTTSQWTIPINAFISQLVPINGKPVQFQFGARYYADKPLNGPEWGLRAGVTLLFPK